MLIELMLGSRVSGRDSIGMIGRLGKSRIYRISASECVVRTIQVECTVRLDDGRSDPAYGGVKQRFGV